MCQQPDGVQNGGTAVSDAEAGARLELLHGWLAGRLGDEPRAWLDGQAQKIAADPDTRSLTTAVGLAPRRVGKAPLALKSDEIAEAARVRPGLDARDWTIDQAARIYLMLVSGAADGEGFPARLDRLFRSGEIGEQIALLRGLPLYPAPAEIVPTASEGIRSAMQPIFEAVAHNSPYPAEQFSEAMWNQMVVKTLFIGSTLAPIAGLDERRNPDLARMLVDYAHERWAAGRTVSPELWRCVGPFAESYLDELIKVFESPVEAEQRAGALALSECPTPEALVILESAPQLWREIRKGTLSWKTLA